MIPIADVKWIKLAVGLPDNRQLKQIRRLPGGDSIALLWVYLLCLAGEINDAGMIYFTPSIPYTEEMLADQFDIDVNTVRLGLETFKQFGMIEVVNNILCLPTWEKWQSTDKLSEMREKNRLRVAKHREKQRLLTGNVTCNVTVTGCNAIEEEIDKELDKERDNISYGVNADETPASPKRKKAKAFTPPTVEEVAEYCKQRRNGIDAEMFVDFYAAKGWMIGKNKMKDWQSAVRTWERKRKEEGGVNNGASKQSDTARLGENIGTWL